MGEAQTMRFTPLTPMVNRNSMYSGRTRAVYYSSYCWFIEGVWQLIKVESVSGTWLSLFTSLALSQMYWLPHTDKRMYAAFFCCRGSAATGRRLCPARDWAQRCPRARLRKSQQNKAPEKSQLNTAPNFPFICGFFNSLFILTNKKNNHLTENSAKKINAENYFNFLFWNVLGSKICKV